MELISLINVALESKIKILRALGYDSDGEYVLNSECEKVLDRYLDIPIKVENMVIFPGSIIVLDNNELSISKYIEEFGDVLG
ncbi:MAG: hypothetical protein Q7S74_05355 [Nanoarchaeota archaeon]|nr:hypothetical protein [Nanoarchaeota archaeon]